MATLLILRGVPGCGKSTFAHQWLMEGERRARVNRDDIRMQFFGKETGVDENMVTQIEHMQVDSLLKAGYSVVVDDTNIRHAYIKAFVKIASKHGVPVAVKQFDVDLKVAIERNAGRAAQGGRDVPTPVIEKMHKSLKSSGQFTRKLIEESYCSSPVGKPYVRPVGKRKIYLFDIDGTLASMSDRSPFDWSRVGEDDPRRQVVLTAQALAEAGYDIVVMSGRDSSCREETIAWLEFYDVPFCDLFMRAEGDMRKDNIVKQELFDQHIRDFYDVVAVFDDRQQVVDMWRDMGVDCFQVAPGDF
ncbi:polynucleotide kinase [Streptomyces phage Samisti12]|uniref:Polynucleotide kinase n=1 Tax=Streptomyces phage Samisti12 TaxID=2023995 RepID=A0A223G049_9CAUD|nr:polynucleotide kinase [Streptomyces phage Samisti12]AST15390.1 polynucleotide kinase [Streptomyces phage Samisti12]